MAFIWNSTNWLRAGKTANTSKVWDDWGTKAYFMSCEIFDTTASEELQSLPVHVGFSWQYMNSLTSGIFPKWDNHIFRWTYLDREQALKLNFPHLFTELFHKNYLSLMRALWNPQSLHFSYLDRSMKSPTLTFLLPWQINEIPNPYTSPTLTDQWNPQPLHFSYLERSMKSLISQPRCWATNVSSSPSLCKGLSTILSLSDSPGMDTRHLLVGPEKPGNLGEPSSETEVSR